MSGYDRNELLAAFRAERGPGGATEDRMWQRLAADVAVETLPLPPPASRWPTLVVAAVAVAAAFVLGWWLRGGLRAEVAANDDARSLSPHAAAVDSDGGRAELAGARDRRPGGIATRRADEPDVVTPAAPPTAAPPTADASPAPVAPPVEAAPQPAAAQHRSGKKADRDAKAPATTTQPAPSDAETTPPPDTVAREAAAIRDARRALASGRASEALTAIATYEREFPRGLLAEEADAVATMARCRLSPSDAADLRAGFTRRHPGSLQAAGVDKACAE